MRYIVVFILFLFVHSLSYGDDRYNIGYSQTNVFLEIGGVTVNRGDNSDISDLHIRPIIFAGANVLNTAYGNLVIGVRGGFYKPHAKIGSSSGDISFDSDETSVDIGPMYSTASDVLNVWASPSLHIDSFKYSLTSTACQYSHSGHDTVFGIDLSAGADIAVAPGLPISFFYAISKTFSSRLKIAGNIDSCASSYRKDINVDSFMQSFGIAIRF